MNTAPAARSAPSLVRGSKCSTPPPDLDPEAPPPWDEAPPAGDEAPPPWDEAPPMPESAPGFVAWRDWCEASQGAPMAATTSTPAPIDEHRAGRWVCLSMDAWRAIKKTKDGAPFTPLDPARAQWRAALVTESRRRPEPPIHHGDRWTERLSARGQKSVENSALYMHRVGKGFRAFVTFTLDESARRALEYWDHHRHEYADPAFIGPHIGADRSSLGREVTRTINTLQQRYRNGLTIQPRTVAATLKAGQMGPPAPRTLNGCRIRGHARPFQFAWVAEAPAAQSPMDDGQMGPPAPRRNIHVHLLINWTVRPQDFAAWAAWIESTWGHGFAKIERLRKPGSAAAYMAKAAKYIAKGAEGGQGAIRGNRYGIARDARPPASRDLGRFCAGFLHEAVAVGMAAPRSKWPPGLYFHKYGFGATCRAAWGRLWQALKGDGFKFEAPPPELVKARLFNRAREFFNPPPPRQEAGYLSDFWHGYMEPVA